MAIGLTETPEEESSVSAGKDEAFCWYVRPSDNEPSKRWGVALVALLAFALGLATFHNIVFGILGFAIILATTAEFWLGIRYKLDSNGASARCGLSLTSIEWSAVKRTVEGPDGIKLSPLDSDSRLDPFRGVYLRYGKDPAPVKEAIRRWLPSDV